ncbi:hypothetical protein [Kineococcus sp. SYSU DK004]|uniref:hypothetical protein n=1 Tax=Kineococcus sp. SYSU DK004 TaxID=3383125 RepID=UPI003D7C69E9
MSPAEGPGPGAARRHGRAAGEPPLLVDPRRWGSLIGLAGGAVFVGSYSAALGPVVAAVAGTATVAGVVAALIAHYVRPVPLGPLARPSPLALAVYGGCVVGELVLIAAGSRALDAAGRGELRPALIALAVGLHFVPFAWAFRERMFLHLGGVVAALGALGLAAGALGVPRAADAVAVLAGLVMIAFVLSYARGRYAPARAADDR